MDPSGHKDVMQGQKAIQRVLETWPRLCRLPTAHLRLLGHRRRGTSLRQLGGIDCLFFGCVLS